MTNYCSFPNAIRTRLPNNAESFYHEIFLELTGKEKGGLKHRARSDSDLSRMQGMDSENGKDLVHVEELMSYERKKRVEEFLGDLPDNQSTISRTADSGVGTWSCAFAERRSKEGAEGNSRSPPYVNA